MAVLQQGADLPLAPPLTAGGAPGLFRAGASPPRPGGFGRQAFGHRAEDRSGHLAEDPLDFDAPLSSLPASGPARGSTPMGRLLRPSSRSTLAEARHSC